MRHVTHCKVVFAEQDVRGEFESDEIGGRIDVRKLTPQQYREIRAKNPELLGLAPKRR